MIAPVYAHMKTKLTVTIDRDLLPRAKRAAKVRGVSLSALIEDALRASADVEQDFVEKWRGSFKLAKRDDTRFRYVAEKYVARAD